MLILLFISPLGIANFLIASGASINHFNRKGHNALHHALITQQGGFQRLPNIVNTLIQLGIHVDAVTKDSEAKTTLHLALEAGTTSILLST